MNRWLAFSVGFLLVWAVPPILAQDSDYAFLGRPVSSGVPAATLGRPRAASEIVSAVSESVRPVVYESEPMSPANVVFRAQVPEMDAPPFRPPDDEWGPPPSPRSAESNPEERYLSGQPERRPTYRPSVSRYDHTVKFGEMFSGLSDRNGRRGAWLESDHGFDVFASPLTNPFLFEDPRSLTELRPILIYQKIPSTNPVFRGGNAEFFGAQGRIAFTDRFSLVINEIGFVSLNSGSGATASSGTGFSEIHLGPKFTFLRSSENKALGAVGLMFQLPYGKATAYQNTGKLSLVPYLSAGKNFFETSLGSINVLDTVGYAIATDKQRTNYFYNSIHLDYDVLNHHQFYPLIELNWFNYTRSGSVRPFGTEGADLANIGSIGVGGKNNLNLAGGFRFKFTEQLEVGAGVEFPLLKRRDLNNFRLTADLIWRY